MSKRRKIPEEVETTVLIKSRRRCCLCFFLDGIIEERSGQLAHLDGDASNNEEDNLVWLCLEHHSRYDCRTSQTKGLTAKEVEHYRRMLYETFEAIGPLQSIRLAKRFGQVARSPEVTAGWAVHNGRKIEHRGVEPSLADMVELKERFRIIDADRLVHIVRAVGESLQINDFEAVQFLLAFSKPGGDRDGN